MAGFKDTGLDIRYTLVGGQTAVKVGDVQKVGGTIGVISNISRPTVNGQPGRTIFNNEASAAADLAIVKKSGTFKVPKATGASSAIALGVKVYWDDTAKVATATVGSNTPMGKVDTASADADAFVWVTLYQL